MKDRQTGSAVKKRYNYKYNVLGEMLEAGYQEMSGNSWITNSIGKYNVENITYDLNGNLQTLQRKDGTGKSLHNLNYRYDGNRLTSMTGTFNTGTYLYDADGNMTTDGRTGVNITDNDLNLPSRIVGNSGSVEYIYDATGTKLAQKVGGSLTYYCGPAVYEGDELKLIMHPEGTINYQESGEVYYTFFKTDHTGSTRVVLEDPMTSQLDPVQTIDYYPFGLAHNYNNLDRNKYLYSGKELQDASVNSDRSILGLYDFGARYYDPLLGRWFNIDPALQGLNPYVYCGNNPIMYVDPNGRSFTAALGFFLLGGSILLQAMGNDGDITNLSWTDIGLLGVNIASI
ncbi:MAG: RHS repeat-associated core domain-containing protein, partial [Odoribacter sp.]|nr:RHS repeat-associated core domain-containing protein [Odoribacter sp.]